MSEQGSPSGSPFLEDERHGDLTLDEHAFVLAHTLHFPSDDRADVLARLGVTAERWAAAERGWTSAFAGEVRREQSDRILRFGAAFAAARRRLRESLPELRDIAPLPGRIEPAPEPPPARPAALVETALTLDLPIPRRAPLPFVAGPPAPVPPPRLGPLAPAPRAPSALVETSLSLDLPIPRGPALPFKGASPGEAPPPAEPPLSLERHASLSVELDVAPDRVKETLARYRVTPEARELADRHWQARMARDPELRAAWEHAYKTYRAWFIQQNQRAR